VVKPDPLHCRQSGAAAFYDKGAVFDIRDNRLAAAGTEEA
jgi:hypothetical protein